MSNSSANASTPAVRQGQPVENATHLAQRTTIPNRNLILDTVIRLYDSAPAGRVESLVAERLRQPRAVVESVVVGWLLQYRSELAALRVGMANAMDIASAAGRDAWRMQ